MKKLSLLILTGILVLVASLFYVETTRAQSEPEAARLFDFIGAEKSIGTGTIQSAVSLAEVREREIRINFADVSFAAAKELNFQLLDGKSYRAVRSESEGFAAFADGGLGWRGKLVGPDGWSGDVTLSVKGSAMSGLIYSPDAVYEIVPREDFRHLLVEIDQDRFPACAGALPQRPASETAEADAVKASAPNTPTAADDGSLIDVLVVYTSDVRQALGGTTQAQTFAQQSINSTNTAYINSGINPRVRLVGTLEASYAEVGTLDAALKWVDDDATVAAARNSAKADMVALIIENASDGCGLAYVMRSVGPGFSGSAFSTTARACAVGNLSFAHELGHNEGCEHNPENGAPAGSASFPYAFGHYVDGSFRTVMSYENPCSFGCNRVAYFSNPSITFNGHPTGIANQRDNHRVINNAALTISQFRDSGGGGGGGGGAPSNNNFATAQNISGNTGIVSGTNVGATKEAGEPGHAGNGGGTSVWYQWQAPATGVATFSTAGSSFDTVLAVYTGSGVAALTTVASNDDVGGGNLTSRVVFNVTAGTIYRVAVDGFNGATGSVTLNWNNVPPSPANDNFAAAQVISGNAGSVPGTNAAATKEAGEPAHGGNSGGSSVWYRWQAPSSGSVTITTAGSGFDTLLGVYTGGSVGALTLIASNDDDPTLNSLTSRVTFNAVSGTTYRIAVDGYANATGGITLNWSLTQSCSFSISPQGQTFTSGGGTGSINVTATAGCSWSAVSNASFVTISSAPGGTGNGTLSFSVAANPNTSQRTGTLTVAGLTFNVTQGAASSVQLGAATFAVNESARKVVVNVTRTGSTTAAASVNYATADGTASRLRDYTQTLGTLVFAPGETSKSVTVFVTNDVFAESAETFSFALSNAAGATLGTPSTAVVTVTSDDATTGANPVGDAAFNADFFVRQHYVDFLNREADASGLLFWTNEITQCGANIQCRDARRINVSAAFFLSIEFQNTGGLVYRAYKAAYGDATSTGVAGTVPAVRLNEFLPDTQSIGAGIVVGQGAWQQQLDASKNAYLLEFVQRPRFLAGYPVTLTAAQVVDKMRQNTGSALTQAERDQLVAELAANHTAAGRASVLRKIAEDATLQANETNRAFVLMQYFGYLRRNPDDAPDANFAGWKFWLDKLNQFNGNFVDAEMVKAFITSTEYRQRFGP